MKQKKSKCLASRCTSNGWTLNLWSFWWNVYCSKFRQSICMQCIVIQFLKKIIVGSKLSNVLLKEYCYFCWIFFLLFVLFSFSLQISASYNVWVYKGTVNWLANEFIRNYDEGNGLEKMATILIGAFPPQSISFTDHSTEGR